MYPCVGGLSNFETDKEGDSSGSEKTRRHSKSTGISEKFPQSHSAIAISPLEISGNTVTITVFYVVCSIYATEYLARFELFIIVQLPNDFAPIGFGLLYHGGLLCL